MARVLPELTVITAGAVKLSVPPLIVLVPAPDEVMAAVFRVNPPEMVTFGPTSRTELRLLVSPLSATELVTTTLAPAAAPLRTLVLVAETTLLLFTPAKVTYPTATLFVLTTAYGKIPLVRLGGEVTTI